MKHCNPKPQRAVNANPLGRIGSDAGYNGWWVRWLVTGSLYWGNTESLSAHYLTACTDLLAAYCVGVVAAHEGGEFFVVHAFGLAGHNVYGRCAEA